MISTPGPASPSNANSLDNDDGFRFSHPVGIMRLNQDPKASALSRNGTPTYTQPPIYPLLSDLCATNSLDDHSAQSSTDPTAPCLLVLEQRTQITRAPKSVIRSKLPLPYPETTMNLCPSKNSRSHQRTDSLPHLSNKHIYRDNRPSFVKFPDTIPLSKPQLHGLRSPHPRCIPNSIGTEALTSLAWIGEISSPIIISGYVPSSIGSTYIWPKLKISDTTLLVNRRASWPGPTGEQETTSKRAVNTQKNQRHPDTDLPSHDQHHRYTLANIISDDRITDENLVELLEDLRLRGLHSAQRSTFRFLPDLLTPSDETHICNDPEAPDWSNAPLQSGDIISHDISKTWYTARRVLLVCRELIQTERHYLASLNILARGETQSPPPSSMTSLLPALIDASGYLLGAMEADPSVLGVCTAFIQAYERLDAAFVQWCEVVGGFFTPSDRDPPVKRSNSAPGPSTVTKQSGPAVLTKRVGSWSRKVHSKGSISIDDITSMVIRTHKNKAVYKTTIRDLAILPTQRITRYVLLFKDLCVRTPSSMDIRTTVEHAANAAMTLAMRADRAQDHAAFRVSSPA